MNVQYCITMSYLHIVLCWLTMYNVTAGKIVKGIIGRNVSFSWTISNIGKDLIQIKHNASFFIRLWPANNYSELPEQRDRINVVVDSTEHQTVTVTVHLLNITINDGGMYRVIRQRTSQEFNDSVLLQTFDDRMIPKITTGPPNILYSTLVLECRSSSSSTGTFLWTLNGSLIDTFGRYLQSDRFLFISNLTVDDQYNFYNCKDSRSGFNSDSYYIKFSGPKMITFAPNSPTIQEHSVVGISCLSDCYPICTWTWTKFDSSSGRKKFISAEKALYIHNVTRQDAGNYYCSVQNKIMDVSLENFTLLEVVYGPDAIMFNSTAKTIQLNEGDSITISCYADCFPPCQIDWTETHAQTLIKAAELKLVSERRNGNYTCRALNTRKNNSYMSDTIYITVKSEIIHLTTEPTIMEIDAEVFPSKGYLPYIVLGTGGIAAVAIIACLLCRKCLRADIVPITNTWIGANVNDANETIPEVNLSGTYWTIVSNAQAEMSSAIATYSKTHIELPPIGQKIDAIYYESEQSMRLDNAIINEEPGGYLLAVHADPVELDVYIHPIHPRPVNTVNTAIQYNQIL